MLKKLLIGVCIISAGIASAQSYCESAMQAARELSGAVKTGDMLWTIEKMYPPLKKQLINHIPGGIPALKQKIQQASAEMKKRGFKVDAYELKAPTGEYLVKNKTEALVIIPTRMVMTVKRPDNVPVQQEINGCLIMVKDIKDDSPWSIIDGTKYNVNALRSLFYDLPANVSLPKSSSKILSGN